MSRISIIKVILCFLLIIINGCLPAISAEKLPIESDHPYSNGIDEKWTVNESGASEMRLHFKDLQLAKTDSHSSYDKLFILDRYGNVVETYGEYSGVDSQDFWTKWYKGDKLTVELVTGKTRPCYGFVVDQKDFNMGENVTSDSKTAEPTSNNILTTTELTSSSNPSTLGQPVTLTAEVDIPSQETKEPSGTVTFMDGTTAIGTKDLTSGHATLITSKLSGGSHSIKAKYSGGNNFEPSTSSSFPLTVQDDNSNPSVKDDNSNPSDHPDSPFTLDNINNIAGIVAAIVGIIFTVRKFL